MQYGIAIASRDDCGKSRRIAYWLFADGKHQVIGHDSARCRRRIILHCDNPDSGTVSQFNVLATEGIILAHFHNAHAEKCPPHFSGRDELIDRRFGSRRAQEMIIKSKPGD